MTTRESLMVSARCHGCGVCMDVCPRGALKIVEGERGFVAALDQEACDLCGACLDVCPRAAIQRPYPPPWRGDASQC